MKANRKGRKKEEEKEDKEVEGKTGGIGSTDLIKSVCY